MILVDYDVVDVHNLNIMEPIKMETDISTMAGVVTVGIFAIRPADVLLLGTDNGLQKI